MRISLKLDFYFYFTVISRLERLIGQGDYKIPFILEEETTFRAVASSWPSGENRSSSYSMREIHITRFL